MGGGFTVDVGKPPTTLPAPAWLLRSIALRPPPPPPANPGCITVTGIAKGHKGPCPRPLDWSKNKIKGSM